MKSRLTIFMAMLASLSSAQIGHAADTDSRLVFMDQMCRKATAPVVRTSLNKERQSLDNFCDCISPLATQKRTQENDGLFALAYREVNIVLEHAERSGGNGSAISSGLTQRSAGYVRDHGVSLEKLEAQIKPAFDMLMYCVATTPRTPLPKTKNHGLRGRVTVN